MLIRALLILCFLPAVFLPTAAADTLLVVGDSLSAAYGMPVEQGWVHLLQQRLSRERPGYRVINASISGDTTAGARARLPQAMERYQPAIVVLELGGNDGLRGLSLGEMQQNLSTMITLARRQQAEVLLIGVHLPPNYGPRYTEKFHAVYHDLAEAHGVALLPSVVDGVGTRADLMQADGIHPNTRAQPIILERVWAQLLPMLHQPPETVRADGR